LTDVSEVLTVSIIALVVEDEEIALMIEATSTSEMTVNLHETTRLNIPENNHLQPPGRLQDCAVSHPRRLQST
jgi:hypothetical protein